MINYWFIKDSAPSNWLCC